MERKSGRGRAREVRGSSYDDAIRARGRNDSGWRARPGAMTAFLLIMGLCVVAAVTKILWIQVVKHDDFTASRESTVVLHAKRGTIYDRNGNVLASSVDCKTIYCNPEQIDDVSATAEILARDLGGNASDFTAALEADGQFSYVKKRVDVSYAEALESDLEDAGIAGIYYLDDTKRVYPYGSVAGQILGLVGADGQGLSGLEYYYDSILGGTDGEVVMERGADGTPVAGGASQVTEAKDGTDVVISLDIDIQQMAESKIVEGVSTYEAESGSVMVCDPTTGEILAACSTPLLDASDASKATSEAMNLKLTGDSYEPGSIFKVLTMAIGIESGKITPDSTYTVPPTIQLGENTVGDDDGRDYTMDMSCTEILRRSSNTGTSMVAQTIGVDTFLSGLQTFGIGTATGIDYPGEQSGIVQEVSNVAGANLSFMSFGQGIAVPMVQFVRAVSAIANDGTMNVPHFLVAKGGEEVDWTSKQSKTVSKETCDKVTEMMRTVIEEGTGVSAQVEGYDIAGKTGTGEQAGESGGYESGKYVSSLIGFANADDPKVLVYVGFNGTPHLASSSAAPVFSAIMSEALSVMGVEPNS